MEGRISLVSRIAKRSQRGRLLFSHREFGWRGGLVKFGNGIRDFFVGDYCGAGSCERRCIDNVYTLYILAT